MKYFTKNFRSLFFALLLILPMGMLSCGDGGGDSDSQVTGTKFTVTMTAPDASKGTLVADPVITGSGEFAENTVITFTATPAAGYEVDTWTGARVQADPADKTVAKLTVTEDVTVSVTFQATAPSAPEGFVAVPTPEGEIVGQDPTCDMAMDSYKGVFRNGRNIKLTPFCIGKYEVTYALWKEVYDWAISNGYQFANAGQMGGGTGTPTDQHPVTRICWRDAVIWCNAYTEKIKGDTAECIYRLRTDHSAVIKSVDTQITIGGSEKTAVDYAYADMTKKGFRLPTQTEYAFAARYQGTDSTNAQQFGDIYLTNLNSLSGATLPAGFDGLTGDPAPDWSALQVECTRVAVYGEYWNGTDDVDQDPAVTGTEAVGLKASNTLGIYNMSGNVKEWCFDTKWGSGVGASDSEYDDGTGVIVDPQGSPAGKTTRRYTYGGCYTMGAPYCCFGNVETAMNRTFKSNNIGFRLACRP